MKKVFINIIMFFIMLFLIIAIIILGNIIYNDILNTDISDIVYTINSISTNIDETTTNTLISNKNLSNEELVVEEIQLTDKINKKYYYEQLTDTQKLIYDGLQKNKENMQNGTYKIQYKDTFSDILETEDGNEKLGQDYQSAVETFLYDNPEVFYIDANKLYLSVETSKTIFNTTYNVYIGPAENSDYYIEGFTSELQVKTAVDNIENIKDAIISNLTGNTYKDILKIHDYLLNNIEYDSNYTSIGSYNIYGALIDKKCVCEGYAKTLKYLLDEANIPCMILQGYATNSSGKNENHAWNCVKVDGKWYYIDSTWDDPIIIGSGQIARSIQYKYFLKGSQTFNKDHILSYQFSEGGRTYKYPTIQEYDYK